MLVEVAQTQSRCITLTLLERGVDVDTQGGEYGNAPRAAAWGGYEKVIGIRLPYGSGYGYPRGGSNPTHNPTRGNF
jgi:hypothetical protein